MKEVYHHLRNVKQPELTDKQKAQTRKYSVIEGCSCSVMSGTGDAYITPYALELQANNAQIGFLSSFTGLLGPVSQVFGSKLIEKYNRKKIVVAGVILQASMWLVLLGLGFLFLTKGNVFYLIPLLILSYILYAMFGSIGGPAWFSMIGDVVPEKIRGRYFANRNRICGLFSVTATVLASVWLFYTRQWGIIIYGFMLLFAIAGIARYISAYFLYKHHVTKLNLEKGYYFSFWQFVKKAPFNNFGKFTIFIALVTLTTNIAGPFFSVYMWKDLQFNPIWFMAVNMSAGVFSIILMPIWGRFADKYGNRELLKIGSIFVIIMPFLWLLSPNPLYLIFVPQLISGIGWAAFNLAASNFIYDAVSEERRAICVAYYNLLNGMGVFLGATLGGLIAQYFILGNISPTLATISIFLFIFILSGIGRLIVVLFMIPKIKEVRQVKHNPKSNPFLYLSEIKHTITADLRHFKPAYGSLREKHNLKR
ncbi:MAG: MFS transporter [Candidatus Pacearchaeota archaeon]|jgi:MFS family permease